MPRRDSEYMNRRRLELLSAAVRVARRKGTFATTLRDIASEAGVSMGAISNHFPKKHDLVRFAATHSGEQRRVALGGLSAATLSQKVSALLERGTDSGLWLDLELLCEARTDPGLNEVVARAWSASLEDLTGAVDDGLGGIPRGDRAALILSLILGVSALHAVGLAPGKRAVRSLIQSLAMEE